jgi:hypothetical protein
MFSRPLTMDRRKASPRTGALRGNRAASSSATVDLPLAEIPVIRKSAAGTGPACQLVSRRAMH